MSMFPGSQRKEDFIPQNDAQKIDASVASVQSKVYASQKLAPFFELEVTLKIFGHEVFKWNFPPKK